MDLHRTSTLSPRAVCALSVVVHRPKLLEPASMPSPPPSGASPGAPEPASPTTLATSEAKSGRELGREHDHHRAELKAQMRDARAAGQRWRRTSRWMGLAIFMAGALLLGVVFYQAYEGLSLYGNPGALNGQFNSVLDDADPPIQKVIQSAVVVFGTAILHVLYLLILGFIASAIAARGIQFFAASEAVIDEAVVPDEA